MAPFAYSVFNANEASGTNAVTSAYKAVQKRETERHMKPYMHSMFACSSISSLLHLIGPIIVGA